MPNTCYNNNYLPGQFYGPTSSGFCWGIIFLPGGGNPRRSNSDHLNLFLSKKMAFCEYWTSIKIKISMTCVSKEYKIKTKMVHEQWLQLKWSLYWVITWKLLFSGGRGRINLWWKEKKNLVGRNFSRWVEWANFRLVMGDFPYPSSRKNPAISGTIWCTWKEV